MYSQPQASWSARAVGEVPGVLKQAEAALSAGLHVAGFLSYEAAPAFDPALKVHDGASSLPLAAFAAYAAAELPAELPGGGFRLAEWQPDQSGASYAAAVRDIRQRIAAGQTSQVNYTMRLRSRLNGPAEALYRELLARQPARYAALVETASHVLLSLSPELFFRRRGQRLSTRPMKGTIRRSADPAEDTRLRARLLASEKDRAENLMITDLLRNDLGRIARPGSVNVPRLLQLESLPTFHTLTSTVEAEVSSGLTLSDTLRALYPCGSVTGAPKVATMDIIRQLERSPREAYCGAIGFCAPDGDWQFNVAIRTLQLDLKDGSVSYGAGGGVTWDSVPEAEYAEALLKASFLPATPRAWRG